MLWRESCVKFENGSRSAQAKCAIVKLMRQNPKKIVRLNAVDYATHKSKNFLSQGLQRTKISVIPRLKVICRLAIADLNNVVINVRIRSALVWTGHVACNTSAAT